MSVLIGKLTGIPNTAWIPFGVFAVFILAALSVLGADPSPGSKNMIVNGGFEDGMKGWGYEQWNNKPVPGAIDKEEHADGASSFKMGMPVVEGGRWISQDVKIPEEGHGYLLSFSLKSKSLPSGAAYVRVGREGRGWLGSETGKTNVLSIGGTQAWKEFKVPVSAKEMGDSRKLTIFFYHDKIAQGFLWIDGVSLRTASEEELSKLSPFPDVDSSKPNLRGDTNRPDNSTFAIGQKVELSFNASGFTGDAPPEKLLIEIVDEHDKLVETKEISFQPDKSGSWKTTVEAPAKKLGFYRVKAKLSDGTELAALGSRPAGFITYIVVPDPAKRIDYGEENCMFGMQGLGWGSDAGPLLGIRWTLDDSLFWRRTEPEKAGQYGPEQSRKYVSGKLPGTSSFRVYALPTLFMAPKWAVVPETYAYETGRLSPEGEKAWAEYCKVAARAFMEKYPDRKKHIYQITWEPIPQWGFKGTDADLIRIYEIAYPILHEADPNAVVAGPCRGIWNNGDPQDTSRLLKLGLGKYMDAFITHPYFTITPEKDGMPQAIRNMKEILKTTTGKDMPMYGSEQGWTTGEDISKELLHAQGLMRQNLITLGEGFQFNLGFTFYDYRLAGQKGYGYYYNLVPSVPFGPNKTCPKPIAAAFAAQSMLLEGGRSAGAIEWLGNNILGYAFERQDSTTLALWNYGGETSEITIPTGVKQVRIYDWMGNEQVKDTKDGSIKLSLSAEPAYVAGVSPKMWGREAAKILVADEKHLKAFPGGKASLTGKALLPGDKPFQGTAVLEPEKDGIFKPMTTTVSLGTDVPSTYRFDLAVPTSLQPEMQRLRLKLCDANGETITATAITLEIMPPLNVGIGPAFAEEGKPALSVALQDKKGIPATGKVDVVLKEFLLGAQRGNETEIDRVMDPGKTKDVPETNLNSKFDLPANGSQRLIIAFPDAKLPPAKKYQALVTVRIDGGSTFSQTMPIHFLGAACLKKQMSIEGDLSEWESVAPVVLEGPKDVIRSPQFFPKGMTAKLRYAWDEKALYVSAEVNDDMFVQPFTGIDTWKGDCIQLAFNLDPVQKGSANAGIRRTSEINVALTKNGPEAFRTLSYSPNKLPLGQLPPEQLRLAVRKAGSGNLFYEMEIPWTSLGMEAGKVLKPGDSIGVAAAVNEIRRADQHDPCALGLFGGITPDKMPEKNGILTLR
ncbi:MAG TPA: hypothetical protein DCZ94_16285 [Lentisphaeria bacterium]|nr:MAG: hypothetical protein A2X48_02050 [Lentisphaerae bacterium GWF2_49_21]HBC88507.1 hypothetical protein [Lentisphaeria bacterium]